MAAQAQQVQQKVEYFVAQVCIFAQSLAVVHIPAPRVDNRSKSGVLNGYDGDSLRKMDHDY